jgi:hypothetical protein
MLLNSATGTDQRAMNHKSNYVSLGVNVVCDCRICNMTEQDNDDYLEWMYKQYTDKTKNPLPMKEWLKQYEAK